MLTEACHDFWLLLDKKVHDTTQALDAKFPEDDLEAWRALVQWCYTGKLPPLQKPTRNTIFTEDITKECFIRLKLCCLAGKHHMVLLQNLAMDSISQYLWTGEYGLGHNFELVVRLTYRVLSKWITYIFQNTRPLSPIRAFISQYLHFALRYRDTWASSLARYDLEQIADLTLGIPDLIAELFHEIQHSKSRQSDGTDGMSWESYHCDFHDHFDNKGDSEVECPDSLGVSCGEFVSTNYQVAYYLKTTTLNGTLICYADQCARDLEITEIQVDEALRSLLSSPDPIATWVEPRLRSFKLLGGPSA